MIFQKESDFTVDVVNSGIEHNNCVERVKEFLFKANQESLNYSQKKLTHNNTCDQILREIELNVRLA